MYKRKIIIIILLLCFAMQLNVFAELRFIEVDETPNKGLPISSINFNCESPFRNNNVSFFTQVNRQYNEPRSQTFAGVHRGIDLKSIDSNNNPYSVYPISSDSKLIQVDDAKSTTYGKYVKLEHSHLTPDGKKYYFQSLYAHLNSISSAILAKNIGDSVGINTSLGVSGGTNKAGIDPSTGKPYPEYGVHLHLETREAASNYLDVTRKYPPNFFFTTLSVTETNKMSFINRVNASNSSVTFRIAPVINGKVFETPLDKVTFRYKADNGTWKTGTMTTSDKINFIANIANLYNSKIEYYVTAKNDAWDYGYWLDAHRPYRYSDVPPTDRPFVATKNLLTLANSDYDQYYCDVNYEEDYNAIVYNSEINSVNITRISGYVENIHENWCVDIRSENDEMYTLKVKDNNKTGTPLEIGDKVSVTGEINKNNIIEVVGADILVYKSYKAPN